MENVTIEPTIIRKRGRPPKESRLTDDKKYFVEYYHKTNRNIICECGVEISVKRRAVHYRTRLHNQLMKTKVQVHLPCGRIGVEEDLGDIKILDELPDLDIHADEINLGEIDIKEIV